MPDSLFQRRPVRQRLAGLLFAIVAGAALTACYPPAYRVQPRAEAETPPPTTRVYFYPLQGQNADRQERDRYECHLWAVRKSGFDPSRTPLAPHQRVDVIPEPPPGANTAAGAVTGAMAGAILAGPRQTGAGMVFGAITGAMLGAATEASQQQTARQIQSQYDDRYAREYADAERQARDYRRAMMACLEGRGYSVQ